MRRSSSSLFVALVVFACGADGPALPTASQLDKIPETDGQVGFAGARLPMRIAVLATTDQGEPVAHTRVRWSITSGSGGEVSDTVSMADASGRSETNVTLGDTSGAYTIRAALASDGAVAVQFQATAVPAPMLTGVDPTAFASGDQVVVRGQALADSMLVEFGGVPASIVTASPDGLALTVTVPPCLPIGTTPIRVRYSGALSNAVNGTYNTSTAPITLGVASYASLDPAQLENGCAVIAAAGPDGAEFLVVPQATTGVPGAQASFRLVGDTVVGFLAPPTVPVRESDFAGRFHDFLRGHEAEFARAPRPSIPLPAPAATSIAVGDRRDFRVCDTVTCSKVEDFAKVTAEARYVGDHAAIYLDLDVPAGTMTEANFQSIGSLFDDALYPVATQAFGAESDIDRNGHVLILMTRVVNGLTPKSQCQTSFVSGFFYAIDVDPAYRTDQRSNAGEVFYSIAPDPGGAISCSHSVDRVLRLVPVTFTHEFQHMINYNQHVLLRGGNSEALWLNEGLSHLSEEIAAFYFDGLGDDLRFSAFSVADVANAYEFLKVPSQFPMLFSEEGTGELEERGAAWLFLRWLTDQYGSETPRRLVESDRTGADNVTAAVGEPFSRLVTNWMLANYVSDLPGFTAPQELRFTSWRFRTTFEGLHQQLPDRFDLIFPIVPDTLVAPRFAVSGTLRSGSGPYYVVEQQPGGRGFSIKLQDPSGGAVSPAIDPRLTIIRLR